MSFVDVCNSVIKIVCNPLFTLNFPEEMIKLKEDQTYGRTKLMEDQTDVWTKLTEDQNDGRTKLMEDQNDGGPI